MTMLGALLLAWAELAFVVLFLTWVIVDRVVCDRERRQIYATGILLAIVSPILFTGLAILILADTVAWLRRRT